MPEQDHLAVAFVQLLERGLDDIADLRVVRLVLGARPKGDQLIVQFLPGLVLAQEVQRVVDGDPVDPTEEAMGRIEAPQVALGLEEDVLGEVPASSAFPLMR